MITAHTVRFVPIYGVLSLAVFLNIVLWSVTHTIQPRWPNVPPPPSSRMAPFLGLGDSQLAYRLMAYQLQVMGNEGGAFTPLYLYDYNKIGRWFNVLHQLDPVSDYAPYLAAFYFGATQKPKEQLRPVIDYLARAGRRKEQGKWRWLSQAVFLAHHRHQDEGLAMRLAGELSVLAEPALPHWARQMPAILSASQGDKETALTLMRSILLATLKEKEDRVDPVEVNFMVDFICNRMQTPEQAARDSLCVAGK